MEYLRNTLTVSFHSDNTFHVTKCSELPRILMIYDVDIPADKARATIREYFYENKDIKDPRVSEMLIEKGYMSLETTMLQHKQKAHLMHFLEGYTIPNEAERKRLTPDATIDEQFARN